MSNRFPCDAVFILIFFKTVSNKTIIRFGFCGIRNNQGLSKSDQYFLTLIIPDITKTSSTISPLSTHWLWDHKIIATNSSKYRHNTHLFIFFFFFHILRENYVFLQVGFQRLSYEMREDVPSYGSESLFGE